MQNDTMIARCLLMMWSNNNSFADIQKILSAICEANMGPHVLIHDIINLSYDEYMVIAEKIKIADPMETIQHFSLCLFIAWVASYKLGTKNDFYKLMKSFIARLPQHQSRLAFDELNTACYEFQIDTFGKTLRSVRDIKTLVKIHAGICEPEEFQM